MLLTKNAYCFKVGWEDIMLYLWTIGVNLSRLFGDFEVKEVVVIYNTNFPFIVSVVNKNNYYDRLNHKRCLIKLLPFDGIYHKIDGELFIC